MHTRAGREENVECEPRATGGHKNRRKKKASLGKRLESLSLQMALSSSVFFLFRQTAGDQSVFSFEVTVKFDILYGVFLLFS